MSKIPEGYYYTKQHEWAREENGMLTLGISDHAQESLGDVVFVELNQPDTILEAGDKFGSIESVKAAEDVYSPVKGVIAEINTELSDSPQLVNEDAYGAWMVKLKDYDAGALESMMNSAAYSAYLETLDE